MKCGDHSRTPHPASRPAWQPVEPVSPLPTISLLLPSSSAGVILHHTSCPYHTTITTLINTQHTNLNTRVSGCLCVCVCLCLCDCVCVCVCVCVCGGGLQKLTILHRRPVIMSQPAFNFEITKYNIFDQNVNNINNI